MSNTQNFTIYEEGCLKEYNIIACAREIVLALLSSLTGFLCLLRIIRFHLVKHIQVQHYFIVYLGAINCFFSTLFWLIPVYNSQLAVIVCYTQLLQITVVCNYYWIQVARVLHREQLRWITVPILGSFVTYFSAISIVGLSSKTNVNNECLRMHWIALSGGNFVLVQYLAVAGILMTMKINYVSASSYLKYLQKRNLWGLIVSLEISSLLSLAFDLTLKTLSDEQVGCSGIFFKDQILYSSIFSTYIILKLFVPMWIMLLIFQPIPGYLQDSIQDLGWNGVSDTTSLTPSVNGRLVIVNNMKIHAPSNTIEAVGSPVLPKSVLSSNNIVNSINYRLQGGHSRYVLNNLATISEERSVNSNILAAASSHAFERNEKVSALKSSVISSSNSSISDSSISD